MKLLKYVSRIAIAVIALVLFVVYMKNDGLYVLGKIGKSELDMINKYATYENKFPDDTIVEQYELSADHHSWFFSHNEYIEAKLLIPNDEMDETIPEWSRNYRTDILLNLSNEDLSLVQYGVWAPTGVRKWIETTSRQIHYTVMKSEGDYTCVYVYVDKLGWNIIPY